MSGSPLFLVALGTLLLNDLVLKQAFGNALTGKLSDFAGLIVFALFWSALLPRRRAAVFWSTAVAFVTWKSPWAGPAIAWFDAWSPIAVHRTQDWSDLVALVVLPIVYAPRASAWGTLQAARWWRPAVSASTVFAFTATSFITRHAYPATTTYVVDGAPDRVLALLDSIGIVPIGVMPARHDSTRIHMLGIRSSRCFRSVSAHVTIEPHPLGSTIGLVTMIHNCPAGRRDMAEMQRVFEHCLIARLDSVAMTRDPGAARAASRRTLQPRPKSTCLASDADA